MENLIRLYYVAANKIEESLFKAIVRKLDFKESNLTWKYSISAADKKF